MNNDEILTAGQKTIDIEIQALSATRKLLSGSFIDMARAIAVCKGRIVTMGIGKSGIIARKVASTLASTGTSAYFVHPVECLHGDMGMIGLNDISLIFSNSGESEEIRRLVLFLKNRQIPIHAVTSSKDSYLAKHASIAIIISVPCEASPLDLVPMASTTAQMVIGDALASALMKIRDFKQSDFAIFHPGGILGKRLLLKVGDIMHSGTEIPMVFSGTRMSEALVEMTRKMMGAVLVVDSEKRLVGILTDGDLRRAVQQHENILSLQIDSLMTEDPVRTTPEQPAIEAITIMENRSSQISVLPVVGSHDLVCGILRLHDLVLTGLSSS